MKLTQIKTIAPVAVTFLCFTFFVTNTLGAVVLQPTAASTGMGELFPASHTRDQSGLSIGYTSGVTDFDTYITSGPTAFHDFGDSVWSPPSGVRSGNFDFALGGTYLVSAMAFWNAIGDPSSVRQFSLLLDDNASFSSPDNVGTFTASNSLGTGQNTAAEVFNFADTSASFVRLQILNTWSDSSFSTVFNEAAFRVSAVPEPTTSALFCVGIAAFLLRRGRGKRCD
jgi:hypothetical protein